MIFPDTDVMIDLFRQYPPAIIWLESLGQEDIALPGFVAMELVLGCRNKIEQQRVERELGAYELVWPSPEACDEALSVFSRYHLSHGIGIIDALIGQTAVALDVPLYTFNQKHYLAVPNLKTVQPYKKGN